MKVWTLMIQRNSIILHRYSMIRREFQLIVRTLIIQESIVIPPSSMVLLKPSPLSSFDEKAFDQGVINSTGTFHCLGFCALEIGFASQQCDCKKYYQYQLLYSFCTFWKNGMVLHCIAWYCMVLHGIAWYCMVLHGIA